MDKVMIGACRCPGAPHAEDWVEMHPQVPIMVGSAVLSAIRVAGDDEARLMALMARAYVAYGIRAWSFTDEDGRGIQVDPSSEGWMERVQDLVPWDLGGAIVADAGDDLYSGKVMRPLMPSRLASSLPGQTGEPTSVTSRTGHVPRKRSRPSSRTSTAGKPSVAQAP